MLKYTYCYLLLFFFFGLSFVSNVCDFALLYVFIAPRTRPGNFECITRFNKPGLNKPFKGVLRRCWVKYVASVVEDFPDANSDTSFELPVPK